MAVYILLLILLIPLLEIATFIQVGDALGVGPTLGLVLLTAIVGVALVRLQGLSTLQRARAAVAAGEPPVTELIEGLLLLLAGFLLLIPGFVTDCFGAVLLIPPVRRGFVRWLERNRRIWLVGTIRRGPPRGPGDPGTPPGPVIEGSWENLDDKSRDDSPWRRGPPTDRR